ncbi:phasin family protein [Sphingomonas sp. BK235]|jgi:phasin family protein|uniref:phasin family protein n=1 Tax=Sphingomonas sp. BK235 TaxID=2512131 RepID=UPI0010448FED|nr:phasin family protein [Sphingomonas sp. BK235]TCP35878.1 phasin family protein [Sphingomonas sp. BK235]
MTDETLPAVDTPSARRPRAPKRSQPAAAAASSTAAPALAVAAPLAPVSGDAEPLAPAPADAEPLPVEESAGQPQPPAEPAAPIAAKEREMTDTITSFADKAQEDTRTAFAKAGEQTRSTLEKGRKVAEDMAEFGKGNVEALLESGRIAAQGFEAMGHETAAFVRERFDSTATAVQSFAAVKSPTELLQLQADYWRGAFDALVKEASRSTEASLKLAGDVAKPLQNRFALAAEKIKTAA